MKALRYVIPALCALSVAAFPRQCRGQEVPRYKIEAKLDTARHNITASQTVSFTNNSPDPIDEVNFNIFPHRTYKNREIKFMYSYGGYFKVNPFPEGFQSGDLRVTGASADGVPLEYSADDGDCTILSLKLGKQLAPGQAATVRVDFEVDIPHAYGRFGWHNGIIALNRWYPLLNVLDTGGCHKYPFYLYHHPYFSDAALYTLVLTLPRSEVVACTGSEKERTDNPDGTRTIVFETAAPVRDFSVGVSARFRLHTIERDGVKINAFYLEGDEARAAMAAQDAGDLISHHSAFFFKYPYPEFTIVPCYLGYGGENSSALIFIDTRVWRLPGILNRYFDFLISHETGHQWFYNMVGSDEYREMFMDEGVNSYWTIRYLEDKYGYDCGVMELPRFLKPFVPNFSFRDSAAIRYLFMARNGLDRPVIGELSSFQEPSSIFALAYGKGQAILEMLERLVGRETFDAAMKRYAQEYKFRNACLADLKRIFNEESRQDLSWFFDEWLTTKKNCDYAVGKVSGGRVILENRSSIEMPVTTRVTCDDGSTVTDTWDGRGKGHGILIHDKNVRAVAIDPDEKIVLDVDRTNNYWPRRKAFRPVPLYHAGYELPMVQDRGAYNIVAGPFVGGRTGAALSVAKPFSGKAMVSSAYDFNGKGVDNRLGYEINPAFGKQAALGFELFDYESSKQGNDFSGGKLYYRKELWPANYGLFDLNDHVTFYLLKERKLDSTGLLNGSEGIGQTIYRRKNESVAGIAGSFTRSGPYPDPDYGWRVIPVQEFGGHFLGGTENFWRSSLELDNYILVWPRHNHKIATRLKAGWGGSADKQLFQMGGADDLRGYSAKSIQGSRMLLASAEYRLPLFRGLAVKTPGNYVNLDTVQLVAFFDTGKAWNTDFSARHFNKDIGLGLRLHFDTIGFLEKTVLRLDCARGLDGSDRETHVWVGISQSF